MSNRKWRWVTRDEGSGSVWVWEMAKKPNQGLAGWFSDFGGSCFCYKGWLALFGIDVPTDKPIKVEFSGKQIGESSPKSGTPKRARQAGNK